MPEPKTRHFWMPDGRSLCDRRAEPNGRTDTAEERLASMQVYSTAPVCGVCIVVSAAIATELAILQVDGTGVWPSTHTDVADALGDTRWAQGHWTIVEGLAVEDSKPGVVTDEWVQRSGAERRAERTEAIRALEMQIAGDTPPA